MKILIALALIISSLPLFAQDTGTNAVTTPPPVPEEARKHFVMGTTLFKDAKTPDDYSQVEGEFKQATDLAPQWPEARYNLALAKEAAGDYSGAEADLKLYQQFKLSDDEARTVQDKIYAVEAKNSKRENMIRFFTENNWKFKSSSRRSWANNISGSPIVNTTTDNKISMVFLFPTLGGGTYDINLLGTIKANDFSSIEWEAFNHSVNVTFDQTASQIHCENVPCPDNQSNDFAYITFDLNLNK
jgi:hypothetical protein